MDVKHNLESKLELSLLRVSKFMTLRSEGCAVNTFAGSATRGSARLQPRPQNPFPLGAALPDPEMSSRDCLTGTQ